MSNALFIVPAIALLLLLLLPLTRQTDALPISPEMEEAKVTVHLRVIELADHSIVVLKQTIVEIVRVCCEHLGIPFDGFENDATGPELATPLDPTPVEAMGAVAASNVAATPFTPTEKILGFSILGIVGILTLITLTMLVITVHRKCSHKYDKIKDLEFVEEVEAAPEYQK